jgi:hypothetical protein
MRPFARRSVMSFSVVRFSEVPIYPEFEGGLAFAVYNCS